MEDLKVDNLESISVKTGKRDNYKKGSQVYFCYSKLSNRLLLTNYGIALEYNKFDHVYIKIDFILRISIYKKYK